MPRCEQCDKDFSTDEAFQQHNADKHGSGQTRHEIKQLKRQEKEEKKKTEHEKSSRKRKLRMITVIAAVFLGIAGIAAFVIYLPKPEANVSSGIGPVGSTHQHADFKVYINGEQLDFTSPAYQVRAREVHVEGGDDDVIHKHATGVTVGHFFKTLGFRINSTCITTDKNAQHCGNGNATLRYFIQQAGKEWEATNDLPNHDITDLDKYLITYGNDSPSAIADQQASVTDKASIESGKGPRQSMPI